MEAEGAGGKWQRGVGGVRAPHTHPARGLRETVVTVANTNSRRPPAARSADARPLHDSPGPAQIAPSVGLGARGPDSPRGLLIGRPPSPPSSQQPPDANRLSPQPAKTWLPSDPARAGELQAPPLASGKRARARLGQRGGAEERGARRREGEGCAALAPEGRAERRAWPVPRTHFLPVGKGPVPPWGYTLRHTPEVKTSQLFNLHKFPGTPSAPPTPPRSSGPQISTRRS